MTGNDVEMTDKAKSTMAQQPPKPSRRSAENSLKNLVKGTPYRPGQSGNPGGRPAGILAQVRRRAGESGEKIIEGFAVLAWGRADEIAAFFGDALRPTVRDRMDALRELADRGFGRAVQTVESSSDGVALPLVIIHRPHEADTGATR